MAHGTVDSVRLGPSRRSAAGGDRAATLLWSRRIACAALVASAGWLLWVTLRPLPESPGAKVDALPPAPAVVFPGASIAARESLLGELARAGNIFAADRASWPVDAPVEPNAIAQDEPEPAQEQPRSDNRSMTLTPTNDPKVIDAFGVLDEPPANLKQELSKLTLVAIYNAGDGAVALVSDKNGAGGMHTLRAGDAFGKRQWTVLAIDEQRDRLILRDGVDTIFALRMYGMDGVSVARPEEETGNELTPIPGAGGAVAQRATPEQIRKELAEAGVDPAEIEALLKLAQEEPAEQQPAAATAAGPGIVKPSDANSAATAEEKPSGDPSQLPPGFADLLRQMTEDANNTDADRMRKNERERRREERLEAERRREERRKRASSGAE